MPEPRCAAPAQSSSRVPAQRMGHQQQPGRVERERGDLRQVRGVRKQRHAKAHDRQSRLMQRCDGKHGFQTRFECRQQRPEHRGELRRSGAAARPTRAVAQIRTGPAGRGTSGRRRCWRRHRRAARQRCRAAVSSACSGTQARQTRRTQQDQQQHGARRAIRPAAWHVSPHSRNRATEPKAAPSEQVPRSGRRCRNRRERDTAPGRVPVSPSSGRGDSNSQPAKPSPARPSARVKASSASTVMAIAASAAGSPAIGADAAAGSASANTARQRDGSDEQQQQECRAERIEPEVHRAARRTDRQCERLPSRRQPAARRAQPGRSGRNAAAVPSVTTLRGTTIETIANPTSAAMRIASSVRTTASPARGATRSHVEG